MALSVTSHSFAAQSWGFYKAETCLEKMLQCSNGQCICPVGSKPWYLSNFKKIGGIILDHLGELWNYIQRVGFISPDFTSLKVRCLVWASPLGFICNSRSKKGMCGVSHSGLNQVSQAVGWNYPLEMLSPSEQRGNLQNQLRKGTWLLNGWTEEIKEHSDLKGFIEITEEKINSSIWSTESRVWQSQLLHGEELIYTD